MTKVLQRALRCEAGHGKIVKNPKKIPRKDTEVLAVRWWYTLAEKKISESPLEDWLANDEGNNGDTKLKDLGEF